MTKLNLYNDAGDLWLAVPIKQFRRWLPTFLDYMAKHSTLELLPNDVFHVNAHEIFLDWESEGWYYLRMTKQTHRDIFQPANMTGTVQLSDCMFLESQ